MDGLTLTDLRGSYEREVRHRERFTPSAAHVGAAATVIGLLASSMASVTGIYLAAVIAVLWGVTFWKRQAIAEWLDLGPARDVIEHRTWGLADRDVEEIAVLHDEYLTMQEEKRQEMEKEAKQGQGRTGRLLSK